MTNETQTREEKFINEEFPVRPKSRTSVVSEGLAEIVKGAAYVTIPALTLASWGSRVAETNGVNSLSGDLIKLGVLYGGLSAFFYGIPKIKEGIDTLKERIPDEKSQIGRVINNCARVSRASSSMNSQANSYMEITKGIAKSLLTAGATALTAYLIGNESPLAIPAIGMNLAILKKNLLGYHPINFCGGYIEKPYFSLIDHFRIGKAWSKIAKLQKAGKISEGEKDEVRTKDCYLELGRNFIGGP